MPAVERLAILITADGQGAIREFTEVGQAAERDLGKAESKVDKLGSKMTSAGAVMMGASAVMVAGLWNAGQAAAAQEQAVGGAEAVFKEHASGMREWAEGAAESAGLSEEAALRLSTRLGGALKGLGFDVDTAASKSRDLVQVGADLAATYGGTTEQAVEALGAAFRGEFDPMEQFNVFLKQSAVDAKAVEMGLAQSTTQVDANARAQATLALITEQSADAQGQFGRETDSTSGRLAIASAQFENAKAQLGEGFLPVMTKVGTVAGTAASGIAGVDEASGGLVSTAASVVAVGLGAAGALSFLGGQAIKLRNNVKTARDAISNFTTAHSAMTNGIAAGAIAITGIVAAYELWQHAIHSTDDQIKAQGESLREASKTDSFDELVDRFNQINGQINDLDQTIKNSSAPWDADYRAQLSFMGAELMDVNTELGNTIGVVNAITAATGDSKDQVKLWVDSQREAGVTFTDAETALAAYTGNIDRNTLSTEDAKAAADGYAQSIKATNDALKATFDPIFAVTDATKKKADAERDVTDANLAAFFAQNALTAAIKEHGPKSAEAAVALRDLEDAQRKVTDAQDAAGKAAMDWESELASLRAQVEQQPALLDGAILKIDAMAASGTITADVAERMKNEIAGAGWAASHLPPSATINVSAPGLGSVSQQFALLINQVDALNLRGLARVQAVLAGGGLPGGDGQNFADGGTVADGWFTVGEEGPELGFKSGSSVEIFSNTDSARMLTGGGSGSSSPVAAGGVTINGPITVVANDPQSFLDQLLGTARHNQGEVVRALGL